MNDIEKEFQATMDAAKKEGKNIHEIDIQNLFKGSAQAVIPYEPEIKKPIVPFLTKTVLDEKSKLVWEFINKKR